MTPDHALSDATLEYAEELTDATLGLDRRYRAESGDDVGLAVLDLSAGRTPAEFADYDAAEAAFADLRDRAAALPEADRRTYYGQFCESMLAFAEWRREGLPLTEQVERFLHVPPDPPTEDDLATVREDLGEVLAGLGYEGSVAEQCEAWKADTAVSAADAPAVLSEMMDEARTATLDAFDLPGEAVVRMDAEGVSGVHFNAKCDYADRTVVLNTDPTLTRPWLRKLSFHEGFPGHCLQFGLREQWYGDGTAPADGLLSVVNCAASATFEGIADACHRLAGLGGDHDRAANLVGRYQAGLATAAAWRYHREGFDEDATADWLADRAVYGDRGWVDNRVRFLTAPERATLMWSYWHGQPAVASAMADVDDAERDAFVRFLYGRLHSPDSVAAFGE